MITIQVENPSVEQYIKEVGLENTKKMILSFLEKNLKLNPLPSNKIKKDSFEKAKEFGISHEVHKKILALKPTHIQKAKETTLFRDEIAQRLDKHYNNKSINEIRDEYFISKGYL